MPEILKVGHNVNFNALVFKTYHNIWYEPQPFPALLPTLIPQLRAFPLSSLYFGCRLNHCELVT